MKDRCYVIVKAAISFDGYLSNYKSKRFTFSCPEDLEQVQILRSECDAILVGAETIRVDDPRLLVLDENLKNQRISKGMPANIIKVSLTRKAKISLSSNFFALGSGEKILFVPHDLDSKKKKQLCSCATIIEYQGSSISPLEVTVALKSRGVHKLLVEGGSKVIYEFMSSKLVDEFRLAISNIVVGKSDAPKLFRKPLPYNLSDHFLLTSVEKLGNMLALYYKRKE